MKTAASVLANRQKNIRDFVQFRLASSNGFSFVIVVVVHWSVLDKKQKWKNGFLFIQFAQYVFTAIYGSKHLKSREREERITIDLEHFSLFLNTRLRRINRLHHFLLIYHFISSYVLICCIYWRNIDFYHPIL